MQGKNIVFRKSLILGIIILFLGASSLPSVTSEILRESPTIIELRKTWYVDDDNCPGPGDGTELNPFCKIQYALENASNGDTVIVREGTYYESQLKVDISIDIIGNSSENTIIDGNGQNLIFNVIADRVKIIGFEIRNCSLYQENRGAIVLHYLKPNNINISSNHFSNNIRDIYILRCDGGNYNIEIYNNNFTCGTGTGIDIGIETNQSEGIKIFQNIFRDKSAIGILSLADINNILIDNDFFNCKQGIYLVESSNVKFIDNEIYGGSIKIHGIFISGNANEIKNNIIQNYKVGIYLFRTIMNKILCNEITNCEVGILLDGTSGNKIHCNHITENTENGILLDSSDQDDIRYNNIANNYGYQLDALNTIGWYPWNYWGTSLPFLFGYVRGVASIIIPYPKKNDPYSVPIKNFDISSFP